MALPYTVLLLALLVAYLRRGRDQESTAGAAARFLLLALVLGALWPLNTWDVPTYAFLALLALVLAWSAAPRPAPLSGAVTLALRCALLLLLAYALFLPFHRHYSGVFSGVERWRGSRTPLNDYLTIHGLFLFVIVTAVLVDLATSTDLGPVARAYRTAIRNWERIGRFRDLHRAVVRGSPAYRVGLILPPAVGVLALALVCGRRLRPGICSGARGRDGPRPRPPAGRTCRKVRPGPMALHAPRLPPRARDHGRDRVLRRQEHRRRAYEHRLQVLLPGVGALGDRCGGLHAPPPGRLSARRSLWQIGWRAAFVGLLAVACLYPILAVRARISDRFESSVGHTLNGLAFASKAVLSDQGTTFSLAPDANAIRWIQANLQGSPVVAEVNTYPTLYGWGDRYAMFTGNPTIVGWDYHQRQQRPTQAELVRRRIADVQKAYGTTDPALAARIFRRYGASYFVVGPLERAYFPAGQAKWKLGIDKYWQLAYAGRDVQIYALG